MDTKHTDGCKRVFDKYDPDCPRCQELAAGSPAREGWQKRYFARKRAEEIRRTADLHAHFAPGGPHATGKCGLVCTFGDW